MRTCKINPTFLYTVFICSSKTRLYFPGNIHDSRSAISVETFRKNDFYRKRFYANFQHTFCNQFFLLLFSFRFYRKNYKILVVSYWRDLIRHRVLATSTRQTHIRQNVRYQLHKKRIVLQKRYKHVFHTLGRNRNYIGRVGRGQQTANYILSNLSDLIFVIDFRRDTTHEPRLRALYVFSIFNENNWTNLRNARFRVKSGPMVGFQFYEITTVTVDRHNVIVEKQITSTR